MIIHPKYLLQKQKKYFVSWDSIKEIWAVKYDVYIGELFGMCILDEEGYYTQAYTEYEGWSELKSNILRRFSDFNMKNYKTVEYEQWESLICWKRGEKVEDHKV